MAETTQKNKREKRGGLEDKRCYRGKQGSWIISRHTSAKDDSFQGWWMTTERGG